MKKLLAFLLLFSHVNFSMLVAQVDETDMFDTCGRQENDINSLVEYIHYAVTGDNHKKGKDEDDDNARYFHIVKTDNHLYAQNFGYIKKPCNSALEKSMHPPYREKRLSPVFYDIQAPPPKA